MRRFPVLVQIAIGVAAALAGCDMVSSEVSQPPGLTAHAPEETPSPKATAVVVHDPTPEGTPSIVFHVPPTPTPVKRFDYSALGVISFIGTGPNESNYDRKASEKLLEYCGPERLRDALFTHLLGAVPHQIVNDFSSYKWAPVVTDFGYTYPNVELEFTNYWAGRVTERESLTWEMRLATDSTGRPASAGGKVDERCHVHTKTPAGAWAEQFWGTGANHKEVGNSAS